MQHASILLIDDDRGVYETLSSQLERQVGEILYAEMPEEGIRLAMHRVPDLILLDINMPRMDGLKVCRHLKEMAVTRDIPIVFLTVDRNVQHIAKGLECGGVDYILKPFNLVELHARVRVALRTKRMVELLKQQARIDALTGLRNRAAMDDALRSAAAAYQRTGQPAALVMIDIDHFKEVNDLHGHGIGDEVLRNTGVAILGCCRPYDTACRYGGDEFGVIYGQTEGPDARRAVERLLAQIAGLDIPTARGPLQIRCSAGLTSTETFSAGFEPAELVKLADQALYRAKQTGRDRLVVL